jgi:hypothetical protein
MRGSHWRALLIVAAAAASGCQSGPSKQTLASAEPALSPPVEGGTLVASAPPPSLKKLTFVERHPLLYKPRDYYEGSGSNTVVKTGAAVLVGVPVGIVGELKQIVVGAPPEPTY